MLITILFSLAMLPVQVFGKDFSALRGEVTSLGLIGYNYTNKDIEKYTVNGVGGGDIRLSSTTSGGGGVTCCIELLSVKPPNGPVKVKWQVDGCMYSLSNKFTGATQQARHLYYREISVPVEDISKGRPRYIEIHFYHDGTAKVLLTQEISAPLVRLDGNRIDHSLFPRCKDGKRPE